MRQSSSWQINNCARAAVIATALCVTAIVPAQEKDLPTGFGDIDIGDAWQEVSANLSYEIIDSLATPWDLYLNQCGYFSLRVSAETAELLVTVNDFVVTEVSFATSIRPGSDLMQVARLVEKNYGPPQRREMRTLFGKETDNAAEANFITLFYRTPHPVDISISGRALWKYQITARSPKADWHANKSLHCAREKEKQADLRARGETASN